MIAAVFDVDRTLLPETTAERLFLRFLIEQRALGARAALETVRFSLLHGWPNPVREVRRHRPYLRGQLSLAMAEMGNRCFEQVIQPRLAAAGIERLREHHARGHRTVLLSGSLPFVLQPLAAAVGADDTICSRMEERNGRLLGR
ncbi:MAG TPA: HAD-IB family phosphatase, partial [Thermomicrobiaceae bacterium]|nr:HAD-IB family phosphatase [Thermomicrobiaceae bacterium]